MSLEYHTSAPHVNKTGVSCPTVTSDDLALVSKTLRPILSTIMALTRKRGYCYASMTYIGNSNARSLSTARRHIRTLIAAGIVRRVVVTGFEDMLFICPVAAWNLAPSCTESERTLIQISDPAQASPNHNKQPARKRVALPVDQPAAPPVVCSSAKGFPDGESHIIQNEYVANETNDSDGLRPIETTETESPAEIASLLAASIDAAEANAALAGFDTPVSEPEPTRPQETPPACSTSIPMVQNPSAPKPVSTYEYPSEGQNSPESASEGPKQGKKPWSEVEPITISPKPQPQALTPATGSASNEVLRTECFERGASKPQDAQLLTPEQAAILTALRQHGTAERQAQQMVRQDARKAQDCLRALAAYIARGEDVPSPGGLLWSLWNRPEFWFVERQRAGAGSRPHLATALGYRIAPTADSIVPPGMALPDADADATRRAVIARGRTALGACGPV